MDTIYHCKNQKRKKCTVNIDIHWTNTPFARLKLDVDIHIHTRILKGIFVYISGAIILF